MFDPSDVDDLDGAATLAQLGEVRRWQRWWQARELALLAHHADVTGHVEAGLTASAARVLHGDRMVPGGADGTPEMSEFAAPEIAALWNEGVEGVDGRIHQALDLRHRLRRLWRRVMDAQLPTWVAARVTMKAALLPRDAAAHLDEQLAEVAGHLPVSRLLRLTDGLVARLTPPADAASSRRGDRAHRGVWVRQRPDDRATTVAGVSAVLDAADADALEQQVRRLARILAQGGDARGLDERRASALAVMAHPARALQLLQASLVDELPADLSESWGPCPAAGQAGHLCGRVTVDPERLLPRADLMVHLSAPYGAGYEAVDGPRSARGTRWPASSGAVRHCSTGWATCSATAASPCGRYSMSTGWPPSIRTRFLAPCGGRSAAASPTTPSRDPPAARPGAVTSTTRAPTSPEALRARHDLTTCRRCPGEPTGRRLTAAGWCTR